MGVVYPVSPITDGIHSKGVPRCYVFPDNNVYCFDENNRLRYAGPLSNLPRPDLLTAQDAKLHIITSDELFLKNSVLNTASYIVFQNNGVTYVENGQTGYVEYSSSNAADAIQYAINNIPSGGKGVIVLKGEFYFPPLTSSAMINVPGDRSIDFVGSDAIIHLPQNNYTGQAWLFSVANTSLDSYNVIRFKNFVVVDDVNTGTYASNFLVTSGTGLGVEMEDIVFYNSPNYSSGTTVWFNNCLHAVVRNVRFHNTVRTGLLFDSVAVGTVSNSLFMSRNPVGSGVAISVGTGNVTITNSEFYGLNIAINASDTDGESTIHVSNSIFGLNRGSYFTLSNGSVWNMGVNYVIYVHNISSLRIFMSNIVFEGYNFLGGDTFTTNLDIEISDSMLAGLSTYVQYSSNGGAGKIRINASNCQLGWADFTGGPGFLGNGRVNNIETIPAEYYLDNCKIFMNVPGNYAPLHFIDNHYIGQYGVTSVSGKLSISNSLIWLKNTSSTQYTAGISNINTEDALNIYEYVDLRNNTIIFDGPINAYLFYDPYGSNSSYANITGYFTDNNIQLLNGATLAGLSYQVGNFSVVVRRNAGYVTENSGVATIPAGSTSVTVSHGLSAAPSKVLVTPYANISVWVTNITSSSFTITTSSAPSASVNVAWYAEV